MKNFYGKELKDTTFNMWGQPTNKPKRQPIAQSTKRAVEIKQKGKCSICHRFLVGSKHFDHIKPVHRGGKSTSDNLRAICASCHDERHILEKAEKMDKKKKQTATRPRQSDPFGIRPSKNPFAIKPGKNPLGGL